MTKKQILSFSAIVIRTAGPAIVAAGLFLATPALAQDDTPLILTSATNDAITIDMPGMIKLDQAPVFLGAPEWEETGSKVAFSSVDAFLVSVTDQTTVYHDNLVTRINNEARVPGQGAPEVASANLLNSNFSKTVVRKLTGAK